MLFFTLILFFLFLSAPCFFVVALELKSSRKMGGSACVGCKIQRTDFSCVGIDIYANGMGIGLGW